MLGGVKNTILLVLVFTVYQEWVLNIVAYLLKTLCKMITWFFFFDILMGQDLGHKVKLKKKPRREGRICIPRVKDKAQ